jgi:hypothetical protein
VEDEEWMISLDADRVATARREAEHKVRSASAAWWHFAHLCDSFVSLLAPCAACAASECGLSRRAVTPSKAGVHANTRARTDSAHGRSLPTP